MPRRLNSPEVLTWIYLMRIYATVTREAERQLENEGLSMSRFDVLAQLSALGAPCTQDYLRARLMVTKGNISGLLRRMETDGLVSRRTDPANRRANHVALTGAGRKLAERVLPQHEQWIGHIFAGLGKEELHRLRDGLRVVLRDVKLRGGSSD